MIPTVVPIVVLLPSLGHRQFCVAGLARGHPDRGEAAIMGVPLPHLVLPALLLVHSCRVSVGVGHVHNVAMSGPGGQSGGNGVANLVGTMVLPDCVCVWPWQSSGPQW